MSKRILITSTDLMMIQFLVPHVINLSENGYEIEIACSDVGNRMDEICKKLEAYVKKIHTVRLVRSPINPINFKGYQDMKKIVDAGEYDIIWTNEPVMGVVTRLAAQAARKAGTKVLYMTHGFHFFDGAPKLNWMIYYPIEKMMAHYTDVITTINKEDYARAEKMDVQNIKYIHGIGVNTERLQSSEVQKSIRDELDLSEEDFLVLSVAELNENKNQKVIIKALGKLQDKEIHYILCGKGDKLEALKLLAKEMDVEKNVHFLGYRRDVVDICSQVDMFAFPSYREGLGLAPLEAMYCGLPLVTSNTRGPVDFMQDGITGFICSPDDVEGFAKAIQTLKQNTELRKEMGTNNREVVKPFCIEYVKKEILELVSTI